MNIFEQKRKEEKKNIRLDRDIKKYNSDKFKNRIKRYLSSTFTYENLNVTFYAYGTYILQFTNVKHVGHDQVINQCNVKFCSAWTSTDFKAALSREYFEEIKHLTINELHKEFYHTLTHKNRYVTAFFANLKNILAENGVKYSSCKVTLEQDGVVGSSIHFNFTNLIDKKKTKIKQFYIAFTSESVVSSPNPFESFLNIVWGKIMHFLN